MDSTARTGVAQQRQPSRSSSGIPQQCSAAGASAAEVQYGQFRKGSAAGASQQKILRDSTARQRSRGTSAR